MQSKVNNDKVKEAQTGQMLRVKYQESQPATIPPVLDIWQLVRYSKQHWVYHKSQKEINFLSRPQALSLSRLDIEQQQSQ